MDVAPNSLRYAAATGIVLIRWDGAERPTVRTVERPAVDPAEARLELARRHLHVFGPSTAEGFATWAGIAKVAAIAAHKALAPTLIPVRTPFGEAWILAEKEARFREVAGPVEGVRLPPSGDAYFLLQARIVSYWFPTRTVALHCGLPASGPALSCSTANSSAPGVARASTSRSSRGNGCRPQSAMRSQPKRNRYTPRTR